MDAPHRVDQHSGEPAWRTRLADVSRLPVGWDPEDPTIPPVSARALSAGEALLELIHRSGFPVPGIFPDEAAGLSLEWASNSSVVYVAVDSSGVFSVGPAYRSGQSQREPETRDPNIVAAVLRGLFDTGYLS